MDQNRVDTLLDQWEESQQSTVPDLSPSKFLEKHGRSLAPEARDLFLRKARRLLQFREKLAQMGTDSMRFDRGGGGNDEETDGGFDLSELAPGQERVPDYVLRKRLGSGGFGEVWQAEGPGGFNVALKFVDTGGKTGKIEARSLEVIKHVRHPNLLSVFGTWRRGQILIIATELADRTLHDRLRESQKQGRKGIPREELLEYFLEAAKGIDALNNPERAGQPRIQHRDIKPENLLLSGGSVKIGDFGLARAIRHEVTGHTGSMTIAYAAPECIEGSTSSRSDQYSLAVTYCYLRTGKLPFEGNCVDVMKGHRHEEPDLSMLPADERPAVFRALEKPPKDRWRNCVAFVAALAGGSRKLPIRDLTHSFQSALTEVRLEVVENLNHIDVLESNRLESTLEFFNHRLIIVQNDFLQHLSQLTDSASHAPRPFKLRSVSSSKVPELATTIIAGSGSAVLVNLITFTSTSWLFFTTTTSAAAVLGGLVGVSAGVATAGIGAAAGIGSGAALNQHMKKRRRKKIRDHIVSNFDEEVVPRLTNWASESIAKAARG